MRVTVDEDIRNALRPLAAEQIAELRAKLKRDGCTERFPYCLIDGVPVQLDGHHRRMICTEEHIAYEWQLIKSVTTKKEALRWALIHQYARRNLSQKELAELHIERMGRIAKAKAGGKSLRKIAKDEKVSVAQVRRDLPNKKPVPNDVAKAYVERRLEELDYRPDENMFHSISRDDLEQELLAAFMAGSKVRSKLRATAEAIKFEPPTLEQVKAYCQERNNKVNAETFMAHYSSNGWLVGRVPMKSWQAAIITWEKNHAKYGDKPELFDSLKEFLSEGDPNELHPGDKRNEQK
jgi:hypothetical protein